MGKKEEREKRHMKTESREGVRGRESFKITKKRVLQ